MHQYSFGIIPLKPSKKYRWKVLLVQHHVGHWSFPKGHAEGGETAQEAAERELFEETGLKVDQYLDFPPLVENYFFYCEVPGSSSKEKCFKTVTYFLAKVKGQVTIQEAEIKDSKWVPINNLAESITFQEAKKLGLKVQELV